MTCVRMLLSATAIAATLSPVGAAAATLPKGDVVVILDESGSMGDEIANIRENISSMVAQTSERIDARYALVGFGGGVPGVPPNEPFTLTDFTTASGMTAALQHSGAFAGNGGGYEMGLDATTYAMTKVTGYRDDAATCAIVISDEPPSFRLDEASDLRSATDALAAHRARWFGVVATADPIVRRTYGPGIGSLAATTGGATVPIGEFRRHPMSVLTAMLAPCARAAQQVRSDDPPQRPSQVATAFGLPAAKRCVSRRSFPIRLRAPRGLRIKRAKISLNGKAVAVRKQGGRFRAGIDLRGLAKGRFTIVIRIATSDGKTFKGKRTYHTCAPKHRAKRPRP